MDNRNAFSVRGLSNAEYAKLQKLAKANVRSLAAETVVAIRAHLLKGKR